MTPEIESSPEYRSLRPFWVLWSGQAISLLGTQIVQFALIWYLTVETNSASVLALASLAGMLPSVALGPIAGALVDRWSRRWIMFGADSLVAGASLILALLFAANRIETWHIFAILLIRSLGTAFHGPAMLASTSLMAPPDYLTRIAGINQMLHGGVGIVSAPLGALAVEALSMQSVLGIDVITALFAILPLLFIRVPQPPAKLKEETDNGQKSLWSEIREAAGYMWQWRGLRILFGIAITLNFLLNPAFSLLPLLIKNEYQGSAGVLAWAQAAFSIGLIAGGALLGAWGGFQRKMATSLSGTALIGIGTLGVGAMPANLLPMAIASMAILGFGQPFANGPIMAILQEVVAPEMQGRVFTLLISAATAASPLGLLIAGPISDLVGVRSWFIAAGGMCVLMVIAGSFSKELLNLDSASVSPS